MAVNPANEPAPEPPFTDAPLYDSDEAQRKIEALLGGESAADAPPPSPSEPQGEDAAPADAQPSGEDEAAEPQETAPIEPPRSWSKEARQTWSSLPRETQDYILSRETERDVEVRRGQSEVAEQRKAIEAQRQAMEQERQQWLAQAQPILNAKIAELQAHPFASLTPQQRMQMRQNEPARFIDLKDDYEFREREISSQWQATQQLAQRQQQEQLQKRNAWVEEQHALIERHTPEFTDAKTGEATRKAAEKYLQSYGFNMDEITQMRDSRLFRVLSDAMRGQEARNKTAIAQAKVARVPPVARPGVARAVGNGAQNRSALIQQLGKLSSTEDQAAILEQLL